MRPRYRELLQVKVTPEMLNEINALTEDTGVDRPELMRQLIEHALRNPPLLLARLAEQGRTLREHRDAAQLEPVS